MQEPIGSTERFNDAEIMQAEIEAFAEGLIEMDDLGNDTALRISNKGIDYILERDKHLSAKDALLNILYYGYLCRETAEENDDNATPE